MGEVAEGEMVQRKKSRIMFLVYRPSSMDILAVKRGRQRKLEGKRAV